MWWETPLGRARIAQINAQAAANRKRVPGSYGKRMYQNAKVSRLTDGWSASNGSADGELVSSLAVLRSRSRALVRDSSYAKRAKVIVVNNVVGTGIGMQAQVKSVRGELNARVNDQIEEAWAEWCRADSCHTGGRLHFADLERAVMAQVFEAGEAFLRIHWRPFGASAVPFALELIEAERVVDDYASPYLSAHDGNEVRMGVEVDQFHRPMAYWIRKRHPNDIRFGMWRGSEEVERVSADQILHLCTIDRWPQTRGEPWLHTAARRLNDMDGYSEAEITRARVQACNVGAIETPEDASSFGAEQDDGTVEMEVEPGVFKRLSPGEKLNALAPTSPNPAMDPFMRYMLREVAAGTGPSYESLSRDYSQGNYSSSRLALLDDRDLWRHLQWWLVRDFRERVHRIWTRQAVLARAIAAISIEEYVSNPKKFEAARFRPRGWSWIDPTKEVEAFRIAVRSGFMTLQDVVSTSGADFEELIDQRKREIEMTEEAGIVFDTDPKQVSAAGLTQARPIGTTLPLDQDEAVAIAGQKPAASNDEDDEDDEDAADQPDDDAEDPPPRRVFSIQR